MKKIYQLIVFCFACLFISSAAFAENTNIPEEAIGAETNQVDETAEKNRKGIVAQVGIFFTFCRNCNPDIPGMLISATIKSI